MKVRHPKFKKAAVKPGHQAPPINPGKPVPANGQPQKSPADILYPAVNNTTNPMGQ